MPVLRSPEQIDIAVITAGDDIHESVPVQIRHSRRGSCAHIEGLTLRIRQLYPLLHHPAVLIVRPFKIVEGTVGTAANHIQQAVPVQIHRGRVRPFDVRRIVFKIAALHPLLSQREEMVSLRSMGAAGVRILFQIHLVSVSLIQQVGDAFKFREPFIGIPDQCKGGNGIRLHAHISKQFGGSVLDPGDLLVMKLPGHVRGGEGTQHLPHTVTVFDLGNIRREFAEDQLVPGSGGVGKLLLVLAGPGQIQAIHVEKVRQKRVGIEHQPLAVMVDAADGDALKIRQRHSCVRFKSASIIPLG